MFFCFLSYTLFILGVEGERLVFCRLLGNSQLLMNSPFLFGQRRFQPTVTIFIPILFPRATAALSDVTFFMNLEPKEA